MSFLASIAGSLEGGGGETPPIRKKGQSSSRKEIVVWVKPYYVENRADKETMYPSVLIH